MSVDCTAFIALAERIIASEESEIAWRVAASRAYYGALHCCLDLAQRHPSVFLDPQFPTHERVYRGVGNLLPSAIGATELKKIIYLTKSIQKIRNDADYEVQTDFLRLRAEQAIEEAKKIHDRHLQFCATHKI